MTAAARKAPKVQLNVELFDKITSAHGCKSDEACARMIGVHRSTISRLRDQECAPTGAVMLQIAEALGVQVEVLFTRSKEES